MRKLAFAPIILVACATANTTVADERPAELPPSVTMTASGAEVRIVNNDRGVVEDLNVPPDAVWEALLGVYEDFDLEPDNLDTLRRRVGVSRVTRSRIADERTDGMVRCGNQGAGPSAASRFRITMTINSAVVAAGGGAALQTLIEATATPVDGTSVSRVACVSTGTLEERIHAGVYVKLGIVR